MVRSKVVSVAEKYFKQYKPGPDGHSVIEQYVEDLIRFIAETTQSEAKKRKFKRRYLPSKFIERQFLKHINEQLPIEWVR